MGKTAFCLNVARNAAVGHQVPVGIFSLEMASHQLALRMLCAEAGVDAHRVRTGTLTHEDWPRLSVNVGKLAEAPIYIDDSPALSILEIKAKARRLKYEKDIGLLIIDYMQLVRGPERSENRQQEISAISQSLKALAKELDIPVISLSQLSRAVEARGGDRRPVLSDLRESGAIEQDADVVIFIFRAERYGQTEEEGKAEIIIGKQRNGPVGKVKLNFVKEFAKFANPAMVTEDGEYVSPY
jgi:replicative DNA helicase